MCNVHRSHITTIMLPMGNNLFSTKLLCVNPCKLKFII